MVPALPLSAMASVPLLRMTGAPEIAPDTVLPFKSRTTFLFAGIVTVASSSTSAIILIVVASAPFSGTASTAAAREVYFVSPIWATGSFSTV